MEERKIWSLDVPIKNIIRYHLVKLQKSWHKISIKTTRISYILSLDSHMATLFLDNTKTVILQLL